MIDLRPFSSLGGANHGWLDAKHHFSFASYHDDARTNWGNLRVWNDDTIAPQTGFPPHPHRDMEIITYVREGAISHEDSLGNRGRTEAGDVQVMSAGTGIRHSEYNAEDVTTKIFQIWLIPTRQGEAPGWGARPFPKGERSGQFVTLASGFADDGDALPIRANIPTAAAMTFITNPFTTPPLWVAAYWIGKWTLHLDSHVPGAPLATQVAANSGWLHWLLSTAGPATVVGLFIITLTLSVVGYFAAALGWRWWIARKWRARKHGRPK